MPGGPEGTKPPPTKRSGYGMNRGAWHGFLDQYPEEFADHVNVFLNGG